MESAHLGPNDHRERNEPVSWMGVDEQSRMQTPMIGILTRTSVKPRKGRTSRSGNSWLECKDIRKEAGIL